MNSDYKCRPSLTEEQLEECIRRLTMHRSCAHRFDWKSGLFTKHLLTERLDRQIPSHRIIDLEAVMEEGFSNAAGMPCAACRRRSPSVARWCATKHRKREARIFYRYRRQCEACLVSGPCA